ncbi:hypothetical protein ACFWWM_13610 [Streptomyces sp. NPDC058682]|uniref:hypothetical protein n=1 Tax=unclassified Streptomyces TaxID=2593676 RepID=UPI002259287F|nr:hypothetical protein [Streptomyces sp. NBC_01214]MCX4807349.1 hypothetical protein [Streptomyces sp. NBC_01214]
MITAVAVLAAATGVTPASASESGQQGTACGAVRLPVTLPVPPTGISAQQDISIGADCEPVLGPVRFIPTGPTTRRAP